MVGDTTTEPGRGDATPSGRFVLRIDPGLHGALRTAATAAGLSLNEYCARALATSGTPPSAAAARVVERATGLFGDALVGVLVYGSWARRELSDRSDVDVLVVLEPQVEITRELYRDWDASPLRWDEHPVEAHFARLPEPDADISGLWAEVAAEGVVLFERELELSRRLVALRRRILGGEIEHRRVHGRSYWVENR